MKYFNRLSTLLLVGAMAVSTVGFVSCNDDDDFNTDQYASGTVRLNVFGPSPVARGGELRFLGTGIDLITSIEIPGCEPITDIRVIDTNEIRITVPQSAQPGYVILKHANGQIRTLTQLTFTEPISIDEVYPLDVKAGDVLTISGEYLNLIGEVIFADEVTVPAAQFVSQSRNEIKVNVPEEARSGKIIISDAAELPNWIYSDDELRVVLPAVAETADLTNAKPGDVVEIYGTNLDLVKSVLMPNGDEVEFTLGEGSIIFTLPENVSDGAVVAVPASGVRVAIANIGVVVPTELVADPAEGLRAYNELTIRGLNMDQVVSVSFPNVGDAVEPSSVSATEVKVAWPEKAQSGEVVLNLKSGKSVSIAVATAKPEVLGMNPNPVAAAAEFTITGKNLDLVTMITFGGNIKVEIENPAADFITLVAPATAESGNLTLTMANGETVETEKLTIDAPECAYVTEVVTEEPHGGELLILKVNNGDKLQSVTVNGQTVQHIIIGDMLYVALPQAAAKGSVVTLISSNGEISYTYDVIPATHIENVIWSGAWQNDAWSGNQDLAYGAFDWSTIPAGAILTLYMTPTVEEGNWWCVSLRHGDSWANLPGNVGSQIDMPADGIASIELTQEILDDLINNMGLIITGQGYILTKITVSWEISLEQTLWEGEAIADDWSNQPYLLSDAGLELAEAGAKAGQTVYFYMTPLDSDWKVQIMEGHWGPAYGNYCAFGSDTESGKFVEYDLKANDGKIGIVLTQEMIDAALTQQWWGGTFLLNGDNIKCTKITIL